MSTTNPNVKFILMTRNNNKLIEFSVDMGELLYICNDVLNYIFLIFKIKFRCQKQE
jgi:hypothetical protein